MKWQVLKDSIPVALASSPEEADEIYMEYDADEIREIIFDDELE